MQDIREKQRIQDLSNIDLSYDLYSFDIFDTLVTRRVATPSGIFAIMQDMIQETSLPKLIKANFFDIRINSEEIARSNHCCFYQSREVCFEDIYKTMQKNYSLSDSEISFLMNTEINTEINNITGIAENINKLKYLISNNKRVILVSDMYFNTVILKKILVGIDPVFTHIKVYVSNEFQASKANGNLYEVIKNIEDISYQQWLHIGDNFHSDIKKSREHGIDTEYFAQINLLPYEKKIIDLEPQSAIFQMIVGGARLARLNNKENNIDKFNFGASFAGPILYNYVDYILEQAIRAKFKSLYFIARDGYIPKIIADILIQQRGLNIKTKYLYGSRKAWRVLTEDTYDNLISIIFSESLDRISLDLIAYKLNISIEDLENITGIKNDNKIIKNLNIRKKIEICLRQNSIKKLIIEKNAEKYKNLASYIKQEIDFQEHFALVDLTGFGTTVDILSMLFKHRFHCFYLCSAPKFTNQNSIKHVYLKEFRFMHLFELLSKNNQGQTLDYTKELNRYIPVLEQIDNNIWDDWGLTSYIQGVRLFTEYLNIAEKNNLLSVNSINLINQYYKYILKNVDKTTAKVLATIPYTVTGKEDGIKRGYDNYRYRTIPLLIKFILGEKKINYFPFPFLNKPLSSKTANKILRITSQYGSLQKFLLNIEIRRRVHKACITILGIKISFGGLIWRKDK